MTDYERQNVNGAGVANTAAVGTGAGYGNAAGYGSGHGAFIANPGPLSVSVDPVHDTIH